MGQEEMGVSAIREAAKIGAIQENARIAAEFIAALNARNLKALAKNLHPELHFIGPAGETHSRESFLEIMGDMFTRLEKVEVTSQFSTDYQTAYVHNMFYAIPGGFTRAVTVLTHEDGKIKKIEMISNPSSTKSSVDELR
jgi:hypothetical protein